MSTHTAVSQYRLLYFTNKCVRPILCVFLYSALTSFCGGQAVICIYMTYVKIVFLKGKTEISSIKGKKLNKGFTLLFLY